MPHISCFFTGCDQHRYMYFLGTLKLSLETQARNASDKSEKIYLNIANYFTVIHYVNISEKKTTINTIFNILNLYLYYISNLYFYISFIFLNIYIFNKYHIHVCKSIRYIFLDIP